MSPRAAHYLAVAVLVAGGFLHWLHHRDAEHAAAGGTAPATMLLLRWYRLRKELAEIEESGGIFGKLGGGMIDVKGVLTKVATAAAAEFGAKLSPQLQADVAAAIPANVNLIVDLIEEGHLAKLAVMSETELAKILPARAA